MKNFGNFCANKKKTQKKRDWTNFCCAKSERKNVMVTGIKLLSQQQVINCSTMGLNGLTAAQIPNQEAPVKRSTSDTRRVSDSIASTQQQQRSIFTDCRPPPPTLTAAASRWKWNLIKNSSRMRMKCGCNWLAGLWKYIFLHLNNAYTQDETKKNQLSDFN